MMFFLRLLPLLQAPMAVLALSQFISRLLVMAAEVALRIARLASPVLGGSKSSRALFLLQLIPILQAPMAVLALSLFILWFLVRTAAVALRIARLTSMVLEGSLFVLVFSRALVLPVRQAPTVKISTALFLLQFLQWKRLVECNVAANT